jgi:hypothetical protein
MQAPFTNQSVHERAWITVCSTAANDGSRSFSYMHAEQQVYVSVFPSQFGCSPDAAG